MIFSAEKWNKASEIKQYIKVSAGLDFRTMEAPLSNAYNQFLLPLIGDKMSAELIEIYKFGPNPEVLESLIERATETEIRDHTLLQLCQRAVANLAFWYDFAEINTRISDTGFQRLEAEGVKSIYKYQENSLRDSFRNKGFNSLDQVLEFLEKNIVHYPEYKESKAYLDSSKAIVKNTAEVDETYYINGSRIIFLRLQPHFRMVADTELSREIGSKAYEHLLNGIQSANIESKFELFRSLCAKYIILSGVARLMAETGSLTDRGLYFSSIEPGRSSDESNQPVDLERANMMIQIAKSDAQSILNRLKLFIRTTYPEYYLEQNSYLHNRDNDNKKTFFA